MSEELIQVERFDKWAQVTMNRPARKNALSIALRDEMSDALDELSRDESVSAVAIRGAGGVFSAGFDLGEFAAAANDAALTTRLWASSDRFHHGLLAFPLPVVAVVEGPALAGGFDLAVCCDLRLASSTAYFAHPEHAFGDIVYGPLRELVGGSVARDLALTGRRIDAAEALTIGLVNRVVDAADIDAGVDQLLASICAAPRHLLRRTKAKIVARAALQLLPTLEL
jgi:enoyl-CoA hydratase